VEGKGHPDLYLLSGYLLADDGGIVKRTLEKAKRSGLTFFLGKLLRTNP
jgi:hypothetical protein